MNDYHNGQQADVTPGSVTRGRVPPAFPSVTLPTSGWTVQCRRLSPDTMPRLRAQAYKELEAEKPMPPVQLVEVGPGERPGDPPQTRAVAREGDPDYQKALADWGLRVAHSSGLKFAQIVRDYAIVTPTDEAEVAAWRAIQAAVGVDTASLSDRDVFIWEIVAPNDEDQRRLMGFVQGLSEAQQEAVRAHAATFRRQLERQAARDVDNTAGAGEL